MFYFNMKPRLKWNYCFSMVTNGSGSGLKFNMEPRLTWNKIILEAKIILFHFRRHLLNEIKLL